MGCAGSKTAAEDKFTADFKEKGLTNFASVLSSASQDTKTLVVSENKDLKSLEGIGTLSKLTSIDASGCALAALPDEVASLVDLEELLVYTNKLTTLPATVGKLTGLTTLNVFNNQIKKLPAEVGSLISLEELNAAANKLMMLTDAHFAGMASLKNLQLSENNLVRMGSLAPCVNLEELRISKCNLEEMPTLSSHPKLTILEIHGNRVGAVPDDYFAATPALQRLSIWGNKTLPALPSSLCKCAALLGVQAQETGLTGLPDGPWPATLETLFVQETQIKTLPPSLASLPKLKRINLSKLPLEGQDDTVAAIKTAVVSRADAIFWAPDGSKTNGA